MKSLVSVDLSKHGMKNFPGLNLTRSKITCFVQFAKNIPLFVTRVAAFLGYWRFIIYLFSSWHLSQPQPFCFGSFFFLWTSGFCVRTTKICKVSIRWTSKVKKIFFALPTSDLTSLMTIWVSRRGDLVGKVKLPGVGINSFKNILLRNLLLHIHYLSFIRKLPLLQ